MRPQRGEGVAELVSGAKTPAQDVIRVAEDRAQRRFDIAVPQLEAAEDVGEGCDASTDAWATGVGRSSHSRVSARVRIWLRTARYCHSITQESPAMNCSTSLMNVGRGSHPGP